MRWFLILIYTLSNLSLFSQDKLFSKTATIVFVSETAIINIAGKNEKVVSFLKVNTGEIAFAVRMTDFTFELPLAGEHFNENYAESEKYPMASFKGKITNYEMVDLKTPGVYPVMVTGELTMHGKTNSITEKAMLTVTNDTVQGFCLFKLRPEEYGIKIPKLVREKIAEEVTITINVDFKPYTDAK
ncbi:MAG: YceI family protein [Bacteroidetes bacterium HGW-Bacteroidetes-21]|jgi:polyisoprenoid-binding protein YceI|nr:MAG: YceI family protein [Bacteroidetes bacterium HGW-Bacteroidetes-21]